MDKFNVSLVCIAAVEEKLLDMVLARFGDHAFSSSPTFGHGVASERLSAIEQVLGRSRSAHIQILMTQEELAILQQALHEEFAGSGIRYWAAPVVIEGVLP